MPPNNSLERSRLPDVTTRLATLATSFLASSLLLTVTILVVWFSSSSLSTWVNENPRDAVLPAVVLASYVVSFTCLARLSNARDGGPLKIWIISLVAASIPLAVLAYTFRSASAVLLIGMAEVAAILVHLAAIGILLSRVSPPSNSLDHSRDR